MEASYGNAHVSVTVSALTDPLMMSRKTESAGLEILKSLGPCHQQLQSHTNAGAKLDHEYLLAHQLISAHKPDGLWMA